MILKKTISLLLVLLFLLLAGSAGAVWHIILEEHITGYMGSWPWVKNGLPWQVIPPPPNYYNWGVVNELNHAQFLPYQCLWCAGRLGNQVSNLTPFIDNYPPSMATWAFWGPFSLQNATAAECNLWHWVDTFDEHDFFFWGASRDGQSFYEGGRTYGQNASWLWSNDVMDFSQVYSQTGDTVSLLGEPQVWVGFYFESNADNYSGIGAFLDDISIRWDDGLFDLVAGIPMLCFPDSTTATFPYLAGEQYLFKFPWRVDGVGMTPMFTIACIVDDSLFYSDRISVMGNASYITYPDRTWSGGPGQHYVEWRLDPTNEVIEADENNNDGRFDFELTLSGNVIVTLFPYNTPIVIPASGGNFYFDVMIQNNSNTNVTLDGWTEVILPNGSTYGPIILRRGIYLPAGAVIRRDNLSQYVPASAPSGYYSYIAKAGLHPSLVVDDDAFPFYKSPGEAAPAHYRGWELCGWDDIESQRVTSTESRSLSVQPNPFNPETTIQLFLPQSGMVSLTVYDVKGREIVNLFDGWYPDGTYEAVFDGSGLTSGIYFARLQAEGVDFTQKLLLLK